MIVYRRQFMIKEIFSYISVVSSLSIIIFFLFSHALKEILTITDSEINNNSRKSISLMALILYVVCFIIFYTFFKDKKIPGFWYYSLFEFLVPFLVYLGVNKLYKEKLQIVFFKENKYKSDPGLEFFCKIISMIYICIFSIFNVIVFSELFSQRTSILSDPELILQSLSFIISIGLLFLSSGYIHAYGVLQKLSNFNFYFSNGLTYKNATLIAVNRDFYIIKENNKKAISIKRDLIEKMEFQ
jgi:hypothetical protein